MVTINQLQQLENFWSDLTKASAIEKEKALLTDQIQEIDQIFHLLEEVKAGLELGEELQDLSLLKEGIESFEKVQKLFASLERKLLLGDKFDPCNAIVSFNAGAGGTESCDWAMMLWRMIVRFAEKQKFKITTLSWLEGETAGLKSGTMLIEGPYAYGLLKSESGIHRLVRISPFDSNSRRHTSFASIYVGPEIEDEIEIVVKESDLRIDVYRSGGAGGQSVNTTDSAVRITHLPTGIVVTCQNERSQLQNKLQAMKILRSRLYDLEKQKKDQEKALIEADKKEIGWGAQIRSYVLHPYKMVKDLRTGEESGNPDKVLEGDLMPFVESFLRFNKIGLSETVEK